VLNQVVSCCIVLYCILLYLIVSYCIILYCIVLYYIILYCTVLYCIVLYCIVLCRIVLYCTVEYRIIWYSVVRYSTMTVLTLDSISFHLFVSISAYVYCSLRSSIEHTGCIMTGSFLYCTVQGSFCSGGTCTDDSETEAVDSGVRVTFAVCGTLAVIGNCCCCNNIK